MENNNAVIVKEREDAQALANKYLAEQYAYFKDTIELLDVKDDESQKHAGDLLLDLKKLNKKLEESRKGLVDPWNEHVKKINGVIKPVIEKFEELARALDKKTTAYLLLVEKRKREAAERARQAELAEMERKKQEAAKLAMAAESDTQGEVFAEQAANIATEQEALKNAEVVVHKNVKSETVSTSVVHNWKARVLESPKVPREYCCPDEKLLNKVAKERQKDIEAGIFRIPGVEFYDEPYSSSRSRF